VTYYASIEPATGDVNGLIRSTDNAVVAQYAYTPWGELEVDSTNIGNSLRWKGLVYDRETGLYYMRARYYDPKIRRFISEDPIGLEGGINTYAFANGDPINRSDPSGLRDCWEVPRVSTTWWGQPGDVDYHVMTQEIYWVQQCNEMTSHTWGDALGLFKDFVTGSGPASRTFGEGSAQVRELRNAPGVQAMRELACNKIRAGQEPNITNGASSFGIGRVIQAGTNATQQFVGSFNVEISPIHLNGMNFVVTNTTSMTSFSYHILPSWERYFYVPHFGPVARPFGNMYQTFTWTETTASCFQ
jgi:RHS repeat-associated protein